MNCSVCGIKFPKKEDKDINKFVGQIKDVCCHCYFAIPWSEFIKHFPEAEKK